MKDRDYAENKIMCLYKGHFHYLEKPVLRISSAWDSLDNYETARLAGPSEIEDIPIDDNCTLYVYSNEKAHPETPFKLQKIVDFLRQGESPGLEEFKDFAYIGPVFDGVSSLIKTFCDNQTEAVLSHYKGPLFQNPETLLAPGT